MTLKYMFLRFSVVVSRIFRKPSFCLKLSWQHFTVGLQFKACLSLQTHICREHARPHHQWFEDSGRQQSRVPPG